MLRLTGGELRGRSIRTPKHDRTRPTQAKLRQALFNSLQTLIPGASVLDLFAGSGALGFEALSRGARRVTFYEESAPTARLISANAEDLEVAAAVELRLESVARLFSPGAPLPRHAPFDVILADPPYAGGWALRLLQELPWPGLLSEGGVFCLEWGVQKGAPELPDQLPHLVKAREKKYGDSMLTTYRREAGGNAHAGLS
jgi:16S rRNA (guanine966-N2)-methyltransferase